MKKIIVLAMGWWLLFGMVMVNFSYADTAEIDDYIRALEVGSPINYRNLTIVPVYASSVKDKTDYVTLDEAVSKGYITITELDGGRVPQVRISNNSDHYILLIAGEILSGCRQDRLVGRDALIGPKSKDVILPVYCSEQGRWTSKGNYFSSEKNQAEPILRRKIYAKESQSAVWGRISEYSQGLRVRSATGALQDVYRDEDVKKQVSNYTMKLENFPRLEEDAVGVVVGLGERVIGVDLFVNPDIFARLWPKLLKSYAALAISEEDQKGSLTQRQAKDILNEIYRIKFTRQPGLELGEDLQANTAGMLCSSLVYRGSVIHLAAFPQGKDFGPVYPEQRDNRIRVIE